MTPEHKTMDLADRLELGARLRRLREARNKTTLQIAEEVLGYKGSHAAVSRLERAVFVKVNMGHLETLAKYYETSVDDLLAGTGASEAKPPQEILGNWKESDIAPHVGSRIRDIRHGLAERATYFARRLGHSNTDVLRQWEAGAVTPNPDTLLQIAAAAGVSGSWLITGRRGEVREPSQAIRVRAMRHAKKLSRVQLGMQADAQNFTNVRQAVGLAENRGIPIAMETLNKLAVAFDCPVEFLDPQNTSSRKGLDLTKEATTEGDALVLLEASLPPSTRRLLATIRTLAAAGRFEAEAAATMLKGMTREAWRKAA